MFTTDDIHPLTDFTRKAKAHIARLKKTGRPEVLTVNGKAAVIVQDAEAYQKLLDLVDVIETVDAIRDSLEAFDRGEQVPAIEALENLRRKHGIPRRD